MQARKKSRTDTCVESKCKKEMVKVHALDAAAKKLAVKAEALMQKGNTNGARKLSQEAWDSFKTPQANKVFAAVETCSEKKCKNAIIKDTKEKLKTYEQKCKNKPGGVYCEWAEDLKKELERLGGGGNAKKIKGVKKNVPRKN
jgi:hypothetical protein